MMTVRDMVSLDTPPKNEAAPISAKAPGSIHAQYPGNDTAMLTRALFSNTAHFSNNQSACS